MTKRRNLILERFEHLLNEWGGFSSEVDDEATNICNIIIKGIKEDGWLEEKEKIEKKYVSFDHKIWGEMWHIDCPVFNFLDDESYWMNKSEYIRESTTNYENKRLLLFISVINGRNLPYNSLFDTVFHEVLHIFQNIKGKKTYGGDLYNLSRHLYKSENLTESMVGKLLYYSFDFEQDAIIHGSWGELKNFYGSSYKDIFSLTTGYIAYNDFDLALDYAKKHEKEISEILQNKICLKRNYTFDWLIKTSTKAFQRFERKITAMLGKFEEISKLHKGEYIEPRLPMKENKNKLYLHKI